ncbi:hypothetical protein [Burkholderia sp. PU8-34]
MPAGGFAARRFVLQHVPALDELAVLDSHEIPADRRGECMIAHSDYAVRDHQATMTLLPRL